MDKPSSFPILSLLDSGENFIRVRDKFRFVFGWSIIVSAYLTITLILILLAMFLEPTVMGPFTDAWLLFQVFGGAVLVVTGPLAFTSARKSAAAFNDFLKDFYPLWFKVKFELLPGEGTSLEERVVSKLRDSRVLPEGAVVHYNATVEGKSGPHTFSVFTRRKSGVPGRVGLVRSFEASAPVSRGLLERLKAEALDVAAKRGVNLRLVVALSRAGFDPDALEWARSPEGLPTHNCTSILLTEHEGVPRVVWIG